MRYPRHGNGRRPLQVKVPGLRLHSRLLRPLAVSACPDNRQIRVELCLSPRAKPATVWAKRLMTGLVLLGACLSVAGCGNSGSSPVDSSGTATAAPRANPTPLPSPTPTPIDLVALLERSGQAMQGLDTFHFHLHHVTGGLELLPGLFVGKAYGDVVNPDRISVSLEGRFGTGFAVSADLITIGDASFMTNPLTGEWQASELALSPLNFFNPARGVSAMMSLLEEPSFVEGGSDNAEEYRIAGTLPVEALSPLVGPTLAGRFVDVALTLDRRSLRLQRAEFAGMVKASDQEDVERVIVLSKFDETITIETPR